MLQNKYSESWCLAVEDELKKLLDNNTFSFVQVVPEGVRVIGNRYIFTVKVNDSGAASRLAARCYLLGYQQRPGYEFDENATYAGVAQHSSTMAVIAQAAREGYALKCFDVKSAFLSQAIDCPVYTKVPWGMHKHLPRGTVALKCIKSCYGLVQSPRLWSENLARCLQTLGYVREGQVDNYLYTELVDM